MLVASANELQLAPTLLRWTGSTAEKRQFAAHKPSSWILLENGSEGCHSIEDFFHCLPFAPPLGCPLSLLLPKKKTGFFNALAVV